MTRKRFVIEYSDGCFPASVIGNWYTRAYDMEHALERFFDSDDGAGFAPVRIASAPEDRQPHRYVWVVL
jgi:hypothetical protein